MDSSEEPRDRKRRWVLKSERRDFFLCAAGEDPRAALCVFGSREAAEEHLANLSEPKMYLDTLERYGTDLPDWMGEEPLSPAPTEVSSTFRLLGPASSAGRTLEAVGAGRLIDAEGTSEVPGGPNGEFGVNVSTELLTEVLGPADIILVATTPVFEDTTPWIGGPLWNGLPAVRNDAVVDVFTDTWYFDTALTRTARLDDIEELVRRFG